MLTRGSPGGGGSGGGSGTGGGGANLYLYDPAGVVGGNVYTDWALLMAAVNAQPPGSNPIVRVARPGLYVIPSAGMPVNGWDFKGGSIESAYRATGATVVELPDGVFFANVGGISNGIVVKIQPGVLSPNGVFMDTATPPGGARILFIALGAAVDHTTTPNPAIVSPGGGTTMVIALNESQQGAAPLSGPLLRLTGNDGAVGVQLNCGPAGGLPDGWVDGGGPGSGILDIRGIEARDFSVPGFTGGGGTFVVRASQSFNALYTPAVPGNWPVPPSLVSEALDALIALIGGGVASLTVASPLRNNGTPTNPIVVYAPYTQGIPPGVTAFDPEARFVSINSDGSTLDLPAPTVLVGQPIAVRDISGGVNNYITCSTGNIFTGPGGLTPITPVDPPFNITPFSTTWLISDGGQWFTLGSNLL